MTTKKIWETYSKDIKRFIKDKVKQNDIADDLLQDTFIKVHTKIHTLKDDSKLKAWLFSVARYTVLDYFKTSNIKVNTNEIEAEVEPEIYKHSEKDCLRGILVNLPQKYRNPIFLADIMGLKQREVAERLKLPLSTVKSQIQRGRTKIAEGFMYCCGYTLNEAGYLVGELKEKEDCKICH
ncbi:sigma-70 family RNA polymerase sigma factor [Tamlana sp. 62-3]|uniref:Sigma-70 family RNA polymerase sigma factor n=1 Tax=Neotamlana sargassicola TaxID=2883125 RepID=A0A9X1L8Z0_9FLAO|nr:sigma-70 family RNA polymerase sigma factor [Tamlana sargassicola]MCB4809343.1 sigma-70 family RNA polymerase sigma factor [Tamlana sargassicola]